jgi:acetyl esterase
VAAAPPALIYPAHFDPLRDEALRYGERLKQAGVAVRVQCLPTFIHGFALMTRASPQAAAAVQSIAGELGEALRRGVS